MAAGPMAGTGTQGMSLWVVMTKSPLTGLIARSVVGGSFGAHLRFAGIELLVIEGKTTEPVYLYIIAFDRLCDQLGLDTISTGNVIGFACELVERDILSSEQLAV
jgi:aldehyde:ferredoxin oxidoreductase